MSDALTGAQAPKRPGMNVESNAPKSENSDNGAAEKSGRNKRRRNRNRKRKNVQAENAIAAPEKGKADGKTAAHNHAPRETHHDQNSDQKIGDGKKSKRSRRRGRGRKPAPGENGSKNLHTGSLDQQIQQERNRRSVPQTENSTNPNTKRRKNRRGGRKPNNNQTVPNTSAQSQNSAKGGAAPRADHRNRQNHSPAHDKDRNRNPTTKRAHNAYAALDLGTNNCRLLVAVPQQPGRFRVVDAYSRIVRLGEGLAGTGRLSDKAMDRAVEALKACAGKLSNRQMKGVRLIATEACRQAVNGGDFLQRVEAEAGLKLEVVDRETEAKLAVAGCASLVDRSAKGAVLFDIGGGSSELALLDLRKRRRHDLGPAMVSWTSMPVGVVTLSERHGGGKHVTREIFASMVEEVDGILDNFDGRDCLEEAAREGEVHLLGTSGTVTTLAGIHLELPKYDRRQVDGIWMQSQQVDDMIEALLSMTFEQRVQNPCIGEERADLVLAGCAILVAIQKRWPCPRLRVADRGLREGLLTEMMNRDNAWQRRPYRGNKQNRAGNRNGGENGHSKREDK